MAKMPDFALVYVLGLLWTVGRVNCDFDTSHVVEFSASMTTNKALENGKAKMEELMKHSGLPKYGDCWTAAIQDLEVGCKFLTADMQSKLAFAFTSCFVEMLGFPPYLCPENTPIQQCVKTLDQRGYNTFLEYFLHTQDMCYYLSSQVWQAETDRTVNELQHVAKGVTKILEHSSKAQDEILRSQEAALRMQNDLVKNNTVLYSAIVRVKQIFDGLSLTAHEHQVIFTEIFDKLSKMQQLVSWIQGELSLLDMFGFYFVALILGFVATATRRTHHARFWLVILYTTTFMIERALYNFWLDPAKGVSPDDLQGRMWTLRRFSCITGFLVVVISAVTYRDFHRLNSNSLKDVQQKLEKLMMLVQESPSFHQVGAAQRNDYEDYYDDDYSTGSESESSDAGDSSDSGQSLQQELEENEPDMLLRDCETFYPGLSKENMPLKQLDELDATPLLSSTPKSDSKSAQRYNLRDRRISSSNPAIQSETPKTFARLVREQYKYTKKMSSKFQAMKENLHLDHSYSADEA